MKVARVQDEDRYEIYEQIAQAYSLAFGQRGLDLLPFDEEELLFHVNGMRRLFDRWEQCGFADRYFKELRIQLCILHYGARRWFDTGTERLKAEQDARRFFVDLAAAQKRHGGRFLEGLYVMEPFALTSAVR